jgi:1-acyl-sn-glycerol-3-phosphate acyltransferase
MVLVRSVIYFVALALSVVVYTVPLVLLGWFLPFLWRARFVRSWGLVNLLFLRLFCGLSYSIEGKEYLPRVPSIVLSKHQSTWETIALRGLLTPMHTWVLKQELLSVPFFGWALRLLRPIAIDRSAGRSAVRQLLREGEQALTGGLSVVVFPEGTRVAPGERKRYGIGGALLAQHTGAPVVPVAHNAGVFWRRRDIRKYQGTIQLVIGAPIETAGRSASEINKQVEDWIEAQVARLPSTR